MQNKTSWLVLGGIVIIIAICGIVFRHQLFPKAYTVAPSVSAVFLTNGQVYFGKLVETPEYDNLTSVYYIQSVATGSSSQPSLVHLGNEIHQPLDSMEISKNQVLFVETLSSTSPVTKAIIGQ